MATLGRSFDAETIPFSKCEGIVCKMYGKPKLVEVNEARPVTESSTMSGCTKKSHNACKLPSSHLASCTGCKSGDSLSHGWPSRDNQLDINWISLPPVPEKFYWSVYYVDVLRTAQPVTVDAKEIVYPVQNYASVARNVTILTTTSGRKNPRTVKASKNVRLCDKSHTFSNKCGHMNLSITQ